MRRTATRLGAPLVLTAAVALAGCGETMVEPEGAEDAVIDVVSRETGFQPEEVECPDDVEAKEGESFECTFTGPEGPYVAEVGITEVDGDEVIFEIGTRRAG